LWTNLVSFVAKKVDFIETVGISQEGVGKKKSKKLNQIAKLNRNKAKKNELLLKVLELN